MTVRRLAAIDIGTVTTRLLIADVDLDVEQSSVTEVERSTDITHLGENLSRTGALAPHAIERVRAVVARYVAMIHESGVDAWAAAATSASRDARNKEQFVRALDLEGVAVQIIDGSTEAALSFRGSMHGMVATDVLVDDIGGGSTELVLGSADPAEGSGIEFARSIDIGSRRLSESVIVSDPPAPPQILAARAAAARAIEPFFSALKRPVRDVVSVAGTATSIVSVKLEMATYDPSIVHGYRLTLEDVRHTRAYLAGMTLERRLRVTGLHPGRAPVIVAGALILEAVLEAAGVDSTLVSEHDILYGILLEVAGSRAHGNVQLASGSG